MTHAYTSTACQHDLHDRCRQTCKFCDAPCQCDCHKEHPMTDHATALAACLPDDPNDHGPIGVPSDAVRGVLGARPASNTAAHARRELALIGEEPATVDWYCRVIDEFMSYGHSGGSASVCIPTLTALLQQEALTPLTDDPAEWIDQSTPSGYPLWQNRRDSRAFSEDAGRTYWWVQDKGMDPLPTHESAPADGGGA